MAWSPVLTNLRDVLAALYVTVQDARRVVQQAGINPAFVEFDNRAINNWHNILNEADKRNKVQEIITIAAGEYPENTWLQTAKAGALTGLRGPDIATDVTWVPAVEGDQLEKIIGEQSTLLPITFLELGLECSRSVVRIVLPNRSSGTGFLTTNNLIVTNNHVIATAEMAKQVKVQFNYQMTVDNLAAPAQEFILDPAAGFATSPKQEDDWTAVRLQGEGAVGWPALPLTPATVAKDDWVNIIQHPGGGPKQIALYHNLVAFADENRVQYLTDTMPGSSGSPVFNSAWQVVALHHSGGWLQEPNSKQKFFRNEGIHINRVIAGMKVAGLLP